MSREVKRVPVDFDWPMGKVWDGFLRPDMYDERPCRDCEGGYSPYATHLKNLWYGNAPFEPEHNGSTPLTPDTPAVRTFAERNVRRSPEYCGFGARAIRMEAERLCGLWNGMWSHHLNQADVNALVEAGRLMDFTHTFDVVNRWQPKDPPVVPTAAEVNTWSLQGFGHDGLNQWVAVRARCEREGLPDTCEHCAGEGSFERWPGQRAEAEAWEPTKPPAGDGWQLWETTSEGSPISPVFPDAEGLAVWMTTPAVVGGFIREPFSIEKARAFVRKGWAPSGVVSGAGVQSGVEWVADNALAEEATS